MICWKEYFETHINTEFTHDENAINEITENIANSPADKCISREEIVKAIKRLENHNAPGSGSITAEVLKTGGEAMVSLLYMVFNKIWREKKTPLEWSTVMVTPVQKRETS